MLSASHFKILILLPIDQQSLISPWIQMPGHLVAYVEPLRIGTLKPFHSSHKIRFRRLHQHMRMISHQDMGVNLPSRSLACFTHSFQKQCAIFNSPKDGSTIVPSTRHMVNSFWIFNSNLSRYPTLLKQHLFNANSLFPGLTLLQDCTE